MELLGYSAFLVTPDTWSSKIMYQKHVVHSWESVVVAARALADEFASQIEHIQVVDKIDAYSMSDTLKFGNTRAILVNSMIDSHELGSVWIVPVFHN